MARRFFSPVLVSGRVMGANVEIWGVNDGHHAATARLEWTLARFDGGVRCRGEHDVSLPANGGILLAVLDLAELGLADPEPLDRSVALRAGLLRARRYHRIRCAVSLADCVVIEVAREHDASVATSDPHLLDVCTVEGITVLPLPDTRGLRWSAN
jgi:hypothetical protein